MYPRPIGSTPATGLSSLTREQQDTDPVLEALDSVKPVLLSGMRENASLQRIFHNGRGDYIATTKALYDNGYLAPAEYIEMILHPCNGADDSAIFEALRGQLRGQNYFNLAGLDLVEQADAGLDLFRELRQAGCMNMEGLQALVDLTDPNNTQLTQAAIIHAMTLPLTFGLHGLGKAAIHEIVGIFKHIHLFDEKIPLRHPLHSHIDRTDVVDWIKIVCGAEPFDENTPEVTLRWSKAKAVFATVLEVFRNHPGTEAQDRQDAVFDAIKAIEILRVQNRIRRPTTHLAL